MKKTLSLVLCVCIALISLCSCNNENIPTSSGVPTPSTTTTDNYRFPTVSDNFFDLVCENSDITLYSKSNIQDFLIFNLVSARNLTGESVTITTNLGKSATITISSEEDPIAMPKYVFLTYQNLDWASLKGDYSALNSIESQHQTPYSNALTKMPVLYSYRFTITLSDLGFNLSDASQPQKIETLSVTIFNETKTYAINNIQLLPGEITSNVNYTLVSVGPLAVSDYPCDPSFDGLIKLRDFQYVVNSNSTIQNVIIPGAESLKCDVTITTPSGDSFFMSWDCVTPFEVDAGSKISLSNITAYDSSLANKLHSNTMRYVIMNYVVEGNAYSNYVQFSIRMRQNPYDIYALNIDGIDTLPYYLEYLNYNKTK